MLIVLINCYQNVVTSYLLKKPRALNSKSTPQLNAGLQASTVVDNPQVLPSTYILYRISQINARFFRASLQRKRARRNILPRSSPTLTCGYYHLCLLLMNSLKRSKSILACVTTSSRSEPVMIGFSAPPLQWNQ
jgi:hypothetical protein